MALLYRAHFGFNTMRLANAAGEDTSVAYGLVSTLLNLLELAPPPTHLAVVFDAAGKTFRRAAGGIAQAPHSLQFSHGRERLHQHCAEVALRVHSSMGSVSCARLVTASEATVLT